MGTVYNVKTKKIIQYTWFSGVILFILAHILAPEIGPAAHSYVRIFPYLFIGWMVGFGVATYLSSVGTKIEVANYGLRITGKLPIEIVRDSIRSIEFKIIRGRKGHRTNTFFITDTSGNVYQYTAGLMELVSFSGLLRENNYTLIGEDAAEMNRMTLEQAKALNNPQVQQEIQQTVTKFNKYIIYFVLAFFALPFVFGVIIFFLKLLSNLLWSLFT